MADDTSPLCALLSGSIRHAAHAMQYRRTRVPGATYFFTVVTGRRCPSLRSVAAVDQLRIAFTQVRRAHLFDVEAAVILPDHLHCIWTLPPGDADFAMRWRLIKSCFTRRCGLTRPVWQKRYWEHLIRDACDFGHHLDYIHYNPVKHGYVDRPDEWPYSSFRQHVALGQYPDDWGATPVDCGRAGHE